MGELRRKISALIGAVLLVAMALVAVVAEPAFAAAPAAPDQPEVAKGAPGSIDVSWEIPDSGTTTLTGFTVTAIPAHVAPVVVEDPAAITVNVPGLTGGASYTFTVTADSDDESAVSVASDAIIPDVVPAAPDAPMNVAAVAGAAPESQVVVTWEQSAENGIGVDGYTVTSSPGSLTAVVLGSTVLTATVSGLDPSTPYTFTVVANASTDSAASAASNSITTDDVPATAPSAPNQPSGSVATNTSVTLTWTAPANNGSAITGYTVTAYPGGATKAATALSTTFTGLTTGTAYTFTVAATNDVGTGPASSPSASVTPSGPPGTPGTPTAAETGATTALVSWVAAAANGATVTYTVTASPGGATQSTQATSLTFTGLTTGTPYTFTVTAANVSGTGGTSAASNPATPIGPPVAPAAPTVVFDSAVGVNVLTVTWEAPSNNGGSPITGYEVTVGSETVTVGAGTTSVEVGLNPGDYTATVTATNAEGTSPASASSASVNVPDVPGLVTNIVAVADTPFGRVIEISWEPPADDGGTDVLSYTVRMAGVEATVGAAVSTVKIGPLPNGFHTAELNANTVIGKGPTLKSNQLEVRGFVPFRTEEGFIGQVFRDFIGREPTTAELAYWKTQVADDVSNAIEIIVRFMNTPESAPRKPVARMYLAYFERDPDLGGYDFWTDRIASNNATIESVSQFFATSDEFKSTYGNLSNAEFVALVYQNVLHRTGEAGGVTYWIGRLDAGFNRGSMMTFFSESDENRPKTEAKVTVIAAYRGMLNRKPDASGRAYWEQRLSQDPNAIYVMAGFTYASSEYAGRIIP